VVEIGDAFGGAFAVSHRCFGEGLDTLPPARVDAVIANLSGTLQAIRSIELPGKGFGMWQGERCDAPFESWRDYLVSDKDRDESRLHGWRRRLAAHHTAQAAFDRGHRLIARLAQACPNVRHVVHNDLPNNLLVSRDNRVTGLFDWGNALAGDPLYDVAWLWFAAPWYPGIDRARVMALAQDRTYGSDVEMRLACYEVHLSVGALQYLASAGRSDELEATALRTVALLDRMS
jgi:hygromycin-B 4-O-kinase